MAYCHTCSMWYTVIVMASVITTMPHQQKLHDANTTMQCHQHKLIVTTLATKVQTATEQNNEGNKHKGGSKLHQTAIREMSSVKSICKIIKVKTYLTFLFIVFLHKLFSTMLQCRLLITGPLAYTPSMYNIGPTQIIIHFIKVSEMQE